MLHLTDQRRHITFVPMRRRTKAFIFMTRTNFRLSVSWFRRGSVTPKSGRSVTDCVRRETAWNRSNGGWAINPAGEKALEKYGIEGLSWGFYLIVSASISLPALS